MFSSSSVTRLSKQLLTTISTAQLGPTLIGNSGTVAATKAVSTSDLLFSISRQSFATNRKTVDAKNVKRLKIQAKKKKFVSKSKSSNDDADTEEDSDQPFLQHQEWVKFQQGITVDGFQTGQTTTAGVLKKGRGGKQARRRKEKELARLQQHQHDAPATTDEKFPAIRFSQEETERLLEQAYGALPKRAGKRGTRNLQKQENRWQSVRDIRAKYKAQLQAAHERRMEKRHWKRQQVVSAKERAPTLKARDLEYQAQVLQRWAGTMHGTTSHPGEDDAAVEASAAAASAAE